MQFSADLYQWLGSLMKFQMVYSFLFCWQLKSTLFEMKFLLVLTVLSVMLSATMAARKLHSVYLD